MPYSLLSRFQGCLLGSGLGEYAATQITDTAIVWNPLIWQSLEPLIQPPEQAATFSWLHSPQANGHDSSTAPIDAQAIATLPLMLFFHDDALKQQQALTQAMPSWHTESNTQASLLALGYAIAQACKQQLNPTTLLSEVSAYLELCLPPGSPQTTTPNTWLATTQMLLTDATDLQTAMTIVQQWQRQPQIAGAIALAFYCFLSAPETLQLSVHQATHTSYAPTLVAAITGALSGTYNSAIGMPIPWLTAYDHSRISRTDALPTTLEIRHQATRLFASWSGSYNVAVVEQRMAAVAAPQVLRPRWNSSPNATL
ncbi:ADP-ribosylglycohydrolase family protein [Pantanalinema rosaneae CENA516]|uniref:ADP-ribosylglycohydrolase family protein n=1 Tax=Pantanalinema rosaneae TaxID=1620701 RepID=UPI003D7018FC